MARSVSVCGRALSHHFNGADVSRLVRVRAIAFVERLETPIILLGGRYDYLFPLKTHQKPFIARLGTPEEHKRHLVYDSGHYPLPRYESRKEAVAWLDRYLGPVTPF